jgi:hypothetical protein
MLLVFMTSGLFLVDLVLVLILGLMKMPFTARAAVFMPLVTLDFFVACWMIMVY